MGRRSKLYYIDDETCPHCKGTGKNLRSRMLLLVARRKSLGITPKEVAEEMKYHRHTIYFLEAGTRSYASPSFDIVEAYEKALDSLKEKWEL